MKKELKLIVNYFLGWRVLLFAFLFVAIKLVPLQQNFLGGGFANYTHNPWLWSWVNFDGEHFLAIVREGYRPLTYFFFPGFPLLVKLVSIVGGFNKPEYLALVGLVVSHCVFFLGLVGFYKLVLLDYKKGLALSAIALLLVFPTSFYFASFYSESVFFALSVWSFYFARKGKWLAAGALGAALTATRVVGVAIFPALLVEAYYQFKENKRFHLFWPVFASFVTMSGFLLYASYLQATIGDPFDFFHSVTIFGQQRQAALILLPQVFYRYFFKILPNVDYDYFPVVFSTYLELLTALAFLIITVWSFFKVRLSYAVYAFLAYLIPTFSGSFSSLPRYVLVLFPSFILASSLLKGISKKWRIAIYSILGIFLGISSMLFLRGYWLA